MFKRGLILGGLVLLLGATFPRDAAFLPSNTVPQDDRRATLEGRVSHVRDGDTIEIGTIAIRFAKLDCAARGTSAGERATDRMKALVRDVRLTCDLEGRQSYDREIGTCRLPDGRDLGRVMIEAGICARYQ